MMNAAAPIIDRFTKNRIYGSGTPCVPKLRVSP
jgi:hypothetical protein